MQRVVLLCAAIAILCTQLARAAEVKIFPQDSLVLSPVNDNRGYFDVMVPTVTIRTADHERIRVENIHFEFLKDGKVLATRAFSGDDASRATKRLASAPVQGFIDAQFVGAHGFQAAMGTGTSFATSATMNENTVLVLTEEYFSFDGKPDKLRIVADGLGNDGKAKTAQAEIPVAPYASPIAYKFPLSGNWLVTSASGVQSHHRFNAPAEFAGDCFKVDARGSDFHGDGVAAETWYAYGAPVMAAADGVVVAVRNDVVQDRAFLTTLPGESRSARAQRVGQEIELRTMGPAAKFPDSITGNIVVIRHEAKGAVEYTSYGHLKTGSARVKVGQSVRQGDVIGEVGDTGDTPVVHLHFQVNAGPDPFNDKSLPFSFAGTKWTSATRDPAHFVGPEQQ